MTVQNVTPTWNQLLELAQNNNPQRRMHRPGQSPSSVPIPSSMHKLPPETSPPVVLYRDADSWCPFCERVWFALEEKGIPFATKFVDLSDKPKWYLDLVPTGLVPAAKIEDRLVYESKEILLALEARFDDVPLLPTDPEENAIAREFIEADETNGVEKAGFRFLKQPPMNEPDRAASQAAFEAKLNELEQALTTYPGFYFLRTFSLVDVMYAPQIDRLAASLPVYQDYHIKDNPRFPNLNTWLNAINHRPAYNRVKTDAGTINSIIRRHWGVEPLKKPLPLDLVFSETLHYRAEAAERLCENREAAIADILKNSGVQILAMNGDISAVTDRIEVYLKLLANYLLHGDKTLLPWNRVDGKENFNPFSVTVGAIALDYVRNRICAPRDMSADAAVACRAAADKVLAFLHSK